MRHRNGRQYRRCTHSGTHNVAAGRYRCLCEFAYGYYSRTVGAGLLSLDRTCLA